MWVLLLFSLLAPFSFLDLWFLLLFFLGLMLLFVATRKESLQLLHHAITIHVWKREKCAETWRTNFFSICLWFENITSSKLVWCGHLKLTFSVSFWDWERLDITFQGLNTVLVVRGRTIVKSQTRDGRFLRYPRFSLWIYSISLYLTLGKFCVISIYMMRNKSLAYSFYCLLSSFG